MKESELHSTLFRMKMNYSLKSSLANSSNTSVSSFHSRFINNGQWFPYPKLMSFNGVFRENPKLAPLYTTKEILRKKKNQNTFLISTDVLRIKRNNGVGDDKNGKALC